VGGGGGGGSVIHNQLYKHFFNFLTGRTTTNFIKVLKTNKSTLILLWSPTCFGHSCGHLEGDHYTVKVREQN